ncbi:hypothetical protein AB0F71_18860 [Kitasatospora sp. NPDC028055]|uniref:hypothetical protein n=1 Tax=Kitasatospora sp. NPDC028055 TaxID=3155653 RepID=UPI0033ED03F8
MVDFRDADGVMWSPRSSDCLAAFIDLLAAKEQRHWGAGLGDFIDDFYRLSCSHCDAEVTIAIGDYGRYSAIRDWHLGDVDRCDLQPASPEHLSGIGRWMDETAVRDGQAALADGITCLFGTCECPRCASVFNIADECTFAPGPVDHGPRRGDVSGEP